MPAAAVQSLSMETKVDVVVFEPIHMEHYCQRIEDLDMPNLDEANFLTGCATLAVSMTVSIVAVAAGTNEASAVVYIVFSSLLAASIIGTLYFGKKYRDAKAAMVKGGKKLANEIREVCASQTTQKGTTAAA